MSDNKFDNCKKCGAPKEIYGGQFRCKKCTVRSLQKSSVRTERRRKQRIIESATKVCKHCGLVGLVLNQRENCAECVKTKRKESHNRAVNKYNLTTKGKATRKRNNKIQSKSPKRKEQQKSYNALPERKAINAAKDKSPERKAARARRLKSLPSSSPIKIAKLLRTRLYFAVGNGAKTGSAVYDLQCTIPEFKLFIEVFWHDAPDGVKMTWENRGIGKGKWQIDHIKPLCNFDLSNREEYLKAACFINMQPLWHDEHMQKSIGERRVRSHSQ